MDYRLRKGAETHGDTIHDLSGQVPYRLNLLCGPPDESMQLSKQLAFSLTAPASGRLRGGHYFAGNIDLESWSERRQLRQPW